MAEDTICASGGPADASNTPHHKRKTASAENMEREQYRLIHASNSSRLEAGEPSIRMQPEDTSYASDG